MTDIQTSALVELLFTGIAVLTPLVGAIAAATFIRRRGRNARLALAGCLVMLPGPIVFTLGIALGLESLMRVFGPLMAQHVLSAIVAPFQLVGFGLVLAGALAAPRPSTAPSGRGGEQASGQQIAGAGGAA